MVYQLHDVQSKLKEYRQELRELGVVHLSLFGSVVHGKAAEASDLDFLVEMKPKTFRNYMGLKLFLEDLFGLPVDLVTKEGLKPLLRERVLGEAERVA